MCICKMCSCISLSFACRNSCLRSLVFAAVVWNAPAGSHSSFEDFSFFLWPLRGEALVLSKADAYFSNATVVPPDGSEALDIGIGSEELLGSVKPGGAVILDAAPVDDIALARLLRPVVYVVPSVPWNVVREAKLAVLPQAKDGQQRLLLLKKGDLDANDHLALGDYGNEYGEYRWGVFNRFVTRMMGLPNPSAMRKYFDTQMRIFDMPIDGVEIIFDLQQTTGKDGKIMLRDRGGKRRIFKSKDDLYAALRQDLRFGLHVHLDRITTVPSNSSKSIAVMITDAAAEDLQDFKFHDKIKPWTTWESYFGNLPPQGLAVVAQTAREKSLMVGDDLSDFYMGRVTSSVPEEGVKIRISSTECASFDEVLRIHHFKCFMRAGTTSAQVPIRKHSALYELAAKEKLSGEIGIAAESTLERIVRNHGGSWPKLIALTFNGDLKHVTVGILDGKPFSKGPLSKLIGKLPRGVDALHLQGTCKLPSDMLEALVPGGIILFEHMSCGRDEHAFSRLVAKVRRLGAVAFGQNIAIILKTGAWMPDAERARFPQPRKPSAEL